MQQHTDAPAASAMLRHARRALLLLGGAFVWWLVFLSGGSAQADGHVTPSDDAHPVRVTSAQLPTQPSDVTDKAGKHLTAAVERTTSTVIKTLRATPQTVTGAVETTTAYAPEPVRTTVVHLTDAVAPALTATTTTVADTVDRTVDAVVPLVDPILQVDQDAPETGATLSAPGHWTDQGRAPRPSDAAGATVVAARTLSADARPDRPVGDRSPTVPNPPAPAAPAPAASGGAPDRSALVGLAAIVLPAALRHRHGRRDDTVPAGPAYQPDSSPD
jgi:hypothetical protein